MLGISNIQFYAD